MLITRVRPTIVNYIGNRLRAPITSRFNFDTYKLVRQLERQNFTRGQAVALMRTINAFLVDSTLSVKSDLVSETQLENELYLSKTNLQDLRNELSSLRQNDSATLKSEAEAIQREVESLDLKFSEQLISLKTDINMDISGHRAEYKELSTQIDSRIQDIHHKLVIRLADLKTNIETMKVELTTNITWMTVITIGSMMLFDWLLQEQE